MREGSNGGRQLAPAAPGAPEAAWLENLTLFSPEGDVWGWAPAWGFLSHYEFDLVVIPKLHLAQRAVYQLVHMRSYLEVFRECRYCGPGLAFPEFQIYGAAFPFYKTGKPGLHQVVTTLKGGSGNLAKIIGVATELLT